MLRIFIILIVGSSMAFAIKNVQISAGTYNGKIFDNSNQYSMKAEYIYRNGLGFDLGFSLVQSSLGNVDMTQITAPFAGIKQYIPFLIPKLKLYLGAGFGLSHVPSDYGKNYVGYHGNIGFIYPIQKQYFLILDYTSHTGKTLNNGNGYNFNSSTISLGVGFLLLPKPHYKQKSRHQKDTNKNMYQKKRFPKKQPFNTPKRRKKPVQSTFNQSQKLMQDLSWPSY